MAFARYPVAVSLPLLDFDALQEIRLEIAAAAGHPDMKLAEAKLRGWRLDVTALLGDIDDRLGDQEKRKQRPTRLKRAP